MNTQTPPRPKIDNNALFAQRLLDNPPEYQIGDLVKYSSKRNATGLGHISGRVFSESDKVWKYTVKVYAMNFHIDDVTVSKYP